MYTFNMTTRKIILVNNEFYHIYNQTVGDEIIFAKKHNFNRAISLINFYRFKPQISYSRFKDFPFEKQKEIFSVISSTPPLVEIYAFCFMPNHYHFLLRQISNDGIDSFISNFQNSFSKYYNKKQERRGALFCHSYKRVRIETEEQFIHLSRYIHLNPVTAYLIKLEELEAYSYTSFSHYMGKKFFNFLSEEWISNYFKTADRYKKFVYNQADYQQRLQKIKNLIFEKKGKVRL